MKRLHPNVHAEWLNANEITELELQAAERLQSKNSLSRIIILLLASVVYLIALWWAPDSHMTTGSVIIAITAITLILYPKKLPRELKWVAKTYRKPGEVFRKMGVDPAVVKDYAIGHTHDARSCLLSSRVHAALLDAAYDVLLLEASHASKSKLDKARREFSRIYYVAWKLRLVPFYYYEQAGKRHHSNGWSWYLNPLTVGAGQRPLLEWIKLDQVRLAEGPRVTIRG